MRGKYKDDIPEILSPDKDEAGVKRHARVNSVSWEMSNNQASNPDHSNNIL